jgi:autotransporter-associated beta strand protein
MKPKSTLRSFLLLAGSTLLAASFSQAADVTWDITPGTIGVGDELVTGGTGVWNTNLAEAPNGNWTTDAGANNIAWVNTNNDTAVFGGTSGTSTLAEAITVGGLKFNVRQIISGNTLTLGSGTVIQSNVGNTNATGGEISSVLAGTGGFTKTGTGWLNLLATTSSLSGNINIQQGTLYTRHETLGPGDIVFTGNSTLTKVYNANANFTQNITIDAGVNATMSAPTFYYNANHGGVLSGGDTSTLTMSMGGNTQIAFNNTANTFTGQIVISGGGTADNGGRVFFRSLADSTQKISISNSLFKLASGGVSMNFANRPIEMLNNNAKIANDSASAAVTLSFAQPLTATIGNTARTFILGGVNTGNNTMGGVISNSANGTGAVSVTKQDAGKWILSGDNTYTGATTVSAGTLVINGDQSLATGAVAVNGTSTLSGSGTVGGNVSVDVGAKLAPGATVGILSIGGNLSISAMAGGPGLLKYELGSIAASDKIAVTGTLDIGADVLNFSDFEFADMGGLQNGTYKLIASSAVPIGSLDPNPANLTGPIGTGTGVLQVTGNDLELVVSGFGPDVTPPTLTGFANNVSGGPVTVGTTVTYTVTFSEDMDDSTVTAADFENGGTSTVTIGSVTEATPTSGVFLVQATPTSVGSLILQVKAGAILQDTAGNDLDTTSAIADQTVITVNVANPYAAWSGGAAFDGDANGDGVENGLAFLLGAASPTSAVTLPAVSQSAGALTLSFSYRNAASRGSATLSVEHSSDLGITDAWAAALVPESTSTVSGVNFTVTAGAPPLNNVTATIPVGEAAAGKLFGRLRAENP